MKVDSLYLNKYQVKLNDWGRILPRESEQKSLSSEHSWPQKNCAISKHTQSLQSAPIIYIRVNKIQWNL